MSDGRGVQVEPVEAQCEECGRVGVFAGAYELATKGICDGESEYPHAQRKMRQRVHPVEVTPDTDLLDLNFSDKLLRNLLECRRQRGVGKERIRIRTLGELASSNLKDLRRTRYFTPRMLEDLTEMLEDHGLSFQPDGPDYDTHGRPILPGGLRPAEITKQRRDVERMAKRGKRRRKVVVEQAFDAALNLAEKVSNHEATLAKPVRSHDEEQAGWAAVIEARNLFMRAAMGSDSEEV